MKKTLFYSFFAALAVCTVACSKTGVSSDVEEATAVAFRLGGPAFEADVETKVDVVNQDNLTSFNVAAATGTAGSADVSVWNQEFTKDGSVFKGGKFWPQSNPEFHFYASSSAITLGASGATVAATNSSDIVCAYLPAAEVNYKSTNTLSFQHIFARIGQTNVAAASGYTISDVSISLVPLTGGTYNFFSGAGKSDGTGWSSTTSGSAAEIANPAGGIKENDIYLVPGSYVLTASWTATRGDSVQTFTGITQTVTIVGGKVNKISTTLGGSAEEIELSISVEPWGENNINAPFDV